MKRIKHSNEGAAEPKRSKCPTPKSSIRNYISPKHLPHFNSHHPDVFKIKEQKEKYD